MFHVNEISVQLKKINLVVLLYALEVDKNYFCGEIEF